MARQEFNTYTTTKIDSKLANKADSSDVYKKTEVYTKTEVDTKFLDKVSVELADEEE